MEESSCLWGIQTTEKMYTMSDTQPQKCKNEDIPIFSFINSTVKEHTQSY